MKSSRLALLSIVVCCFFLAGAVPAGAADLKSEVVSCFPAPPKGYKAEAVEFDEPLVKDLAGYLAQGKEIGRAYSGGIGFHISLLGQGVEAFKFAVGGQTPGCEVIDLGGKKGALMYHEMFVVVVAGKVAVLYEPDEEWDQVKKPVLAAARKFDYAKLESLLK